MTVPAQPAGPPDPAPDAAVTSAGRGGPALFPAQIRADVRHERSLALRAAGVLAVLAVIFVLRALFTG